MPQTYEPRWVCLDGMNADELAAYDYGCASAHSAITNVLNGKDTGEGVKNEPWESVRRSLLELVAQASMPGMSTMNRLIAYTAAAKLRELGYEWNGTAWEQKK